MWEQGYLDTSQMAGAFQLLRSNDLIWSRIVHEYLLGERQPMNDLMAWNADAHAHALPHALRISAPACSCDNDLAEGRYEVDGRPIALTDIRVPIFAVGTEQRPRRALALGLQDPPPDRHRRDLRADHRRPQRRHRQRARPSATAATRSRPSARATCTSIPRPGRPPRRRATAPGGRNGWPGCTSIRAGDGRAARDGRAAGRLSAAR